MRLQRVHQLVVTSGFRKKAEAPAMFLWLALSALDVFTEMNVKSGVWPMRDLVYGEVLPRRSVEFYAEDSVLL